MSAAVIAAVTASNAGAAAAAARRRREQCQVVLDGFNPNGATVEDKQAYASCVNYMMPIHHDASAGEIAAEKAFVALIFVAALLGAWYGKREFGEWLDAFFGAIFGVALFVGACLLVGLVATGFAFLFS